MNDECTKGRDKRDDNHSRGVHGALRVLVTPASSFALTRSDQIGRLLMMNTKEQYEKGGAWVLRESRGGSVGRGPGGVAVERGGGSRKPLVPRDARAARIRCGHAADDYRRSGGGAAVGADGGEVQEVDSSEADAGVGADGGGGAA